MKKIIACLAAVYLLLTPAFAENEVNLLPHETEFLEHEVTRCYSDTGLAERVGICAVVLSRLRREEYPNTVAGVIESLRFEGEFTKEADDTPDEESKRITHDALSMALSGADPTGGMSSFHKVEVKLKGLKLDGFGKNETDEKQENLRIGEVEFW